MKQLFVGNLSFQSTEADLRTLFSPFGELGRINIPVDRETGRARGFAFVEMTDDQGARKAIAALDGKEFGGRNLKVNEARPKEYSAPSGQGRGGGGNAGRGRSGGQGRRDSGGRDSYEGAARQPREPRW